MLLKRKSHLQLRFIILLWFFGQSDAKVIHWKLARLFRMFPPMAYLRAERVRRGSAIFGVFLMLFVAGKSIGADCPTISNTPQETNDFALVQAFAEVSRAARSMMELGLPE